jgi:hypothetical protein
MPLVRKKRFLATGHCPFSVDAGYDSNPWHLNNNFTNNFGERIPFILLTTK